MPPSIPPLDSWMQDIHPRREYPRVVDSRGRFVADCDSKEIARLIAAAPELLAALRKIAAAHCFNVANLKPTEVHEIAFNAIAKATGQKG